MEPYLQLVTPDAYPGGLPHEGITFTFRDVCERITVGTNADGLGMTSYSYNVVYCYGMPLNDASIGVVLPPKGESLMFEPVGRQRRYRVNVWANLVCVQFMTHDGKVVATRYPRTLDELDRLLETLIADYQAVGTPDYTIDQSRGLIQAADGLVTIMGVVLNPALVTELRVVPGKPLSFKVLTSPKVNGWTPVVVWGYAVQVDGQFVRSFAQLQERLQRLITGYHAMGLMILAI